MNGPGGGPSTKEVLLWVALATPGVMARPWLWRTALRFVAWPPWGSMPYLKFRYQTAYGNDYRGDPKDLVPFLRWARAANAYAERS